jgi:uncharacterized repeat protein (TIGR03803 family)
MKKTSFAFCLKTIAFLFSALIAAPAIAQTNYTILKSFTGIPDGAIPYGTLQWGSNGALYGTTLAGGSTNAGSIFRLNPDGTGYKLLKIFSGSPGMGPEADLVLATNGMFCGTTYGGGTSNLGTVFTIDQNGGNFSVLHSFLGGSDGANPEAALLLGNDGRLYGTTYFANSATRGTIFKLDEDGKNYSVIHTFTGNPDGQQPVARLLQASDDALYGTTAFGGSSATGTVFTLGTDGSSYAVLVNFTDLGGPDAGLMEGSDGALYGTTSRGGTSSAGTVFTLNLGGGGYRVIHTFTNSGGDANEPDSDLVEGTNGALYGCSLLGGNANDGTIFAMNKDGSGYSVLRMFTSAGGYQPRGAFLKGTNSIFYGATSYNSTNAGCIYALSASPLPSRILAFSPTVNSNSIQFAGTSGIQYDVQRSTDLQSWATLKTFLMPVNGQTNYNDSTPPNPAAFYRVKQD